MTTRSAPVPARTAGSRLFEPLLDELDYQVEQIDGTLPPELTGTLYRIGPGKWQVGDTLLHHIFDGDGMVSQFTLDGRSVRFRNRYVRTPQFLHGQTSNTIRHRPIGTQRPGGPLANFLRLPANVANTNLAFHAGNLLALWEGGRPHKLDPDTLATLGEHDFDGRLRFLGAFSAHPKWDPATGEMFNFGLELLPRPQIRCYRIDPAGRLRHLAGVPMWDLPWNHDFALTEKHLVFVLDPILSDIRKLVLATCSYMETLDYHRAKGTRFLLVPRSGGKPRVVEYEGLVHFHVTNAYEDGSDTVVDLVLYEDWNELKRSVQDFRTGEPLPPSRLMRYRITPAGRVTAQELAPCTGEFPQYDWRVSTRRHRYTYLPGQGTTPGSSGGALVYDSLLKIDHDTGHVTTHHVGTDCGIGEPLFVPRTPDAAEDDGWLLAVVYNAREHRSQLLVLDARDLGADPIAVAHLPHHIPVGFHGTFTRRVAQPGSPMPHPDRLARPGPVS